MPELSYWNEPLPLIELIALNQMGYGQNPADLEKVRQMGLKHYVEEQLYPNDNQDTLLQQKLDTAHLHIEYSYKERKFLKSGRQHGYGLYTVSGNCVKYWSSYGTIISM